MYVKTVGELMEHLKSIPPETVFTRHTTGHFRVTEKCECFVGFIPETKLTTPVSGTLGVVMETGEVIPSVRVYC